MSEFSLQVATSSVGCPERILPSVYFFRWSVEVADHRPSGSVASWLLIRRGKTGGHFKNTATCHSWAVVASEAKGTSLVARLCFTRYNLFASESVAHTKPLIDRLKDKCLLWLQKSVWRWWSFSSSSGCFLSSQMAFSGLVVVWVCFSSRLEDTYPPVEERGERAHVSVHLLFVLLWLFFIFYYLIEHWLHNSCWYFQRN